MIGHDLADIDMLCLSVKDRESHRLIQRKANMLCKLRIAI